MTLVGPLHAHGAERTVVIGLASSFPNQDMNGGAPRGLLFDVGDAALRRAGFSPTYRDLPWARLYNQLDVGGVDGAIGVFGATSTRRSALFSDPIMSQFTILIARRGSKLAPTALKDLDGLTLGGRLGLSYSALEARPLINLLRSPNDDANVRKLLHGRIDAAIVGSVTGLFSLRSRELFDLIKPLAALEEIPLGLALADERFGPGDLAALNTALKAVLDEGALEAAAERYGVADLLAAPRLIK